MTTKNETFSSLLLGNSLAYGHRAIFDDFLTVTLFAFSQNLLTGKSYDEDLYLQIMAKYKDQKERELFGELLALLILEKEERYYGGSGNDVLGEFYELHVANKNSGQFFTPWHICTMIAKLNGAIAESETTRRQRILDPACGSGRMLLASAKTLGYDQEYYGIDIDLHCVKMAAINLFLNGIFHAEVMCADSLRPDDFRVSYRISFLPFGIFKIDKRENSRLWNMHRQAFTKAPKKEIILSSDSLEAKILSKGSQLTMF